MLRATILTVCLLLLAPAGPAEAAGPQILTVIGEVANTNRPAFDPFKDAFIGYHDRSFEKAFAFDREALSALPQVTVTARAEGWPAAVSASGPLLADVMAAAGVDPGAALTFLAFDGYAVTLTPDERAGVDWVLALATDGEPLSVGGRGPLWLLRDTGETTATAEDEAKWIWSLFLVSAGQ